MYLKESSYHFQTNERAEINVTTEFSTEIMTTVVLKNIS